MNKISVRFKRFALIFAGVSKILIHPASSAGWIITGLGSLGPRRTLSEANSINNSGRGVGDSYYADGRSGLYAFIIGPSGDGMTNLGSLDGGRESLAYGINSSG